MISTVFAGDAIFPKQYVSFCVCFYVWPVLSDCVIEVDMQVISDMA